jgi:hypothetical protein
MLPKAGHEEILSAIDREKKNGLDVMALMPGSCVAVIYPAFPNSQGKFKLASRANLTACSLFPLRVL